MRTWKIQQKFLYNLGFEGLEFADIIIIKENQMDKKMENETEAAILLRV